MNKIEPHVVRAVLCPILHRHLIAVDDCPILRGQTPCCPKRWHDQEVSPPAVESIAVEQPTLMSVPVVRRLGDD